MLPRFFEVVEARHYNGTLLMPVFRLLKVRKVMDTKNEKLLAALRLIILLEESLIEEGVLKPNYALFVCRRK